MNEVTREDVAAFVPKIHHMPSLHRLDPNCQESSTGHALVKKPETQHLLQANSSQRVPMFAAASFDSSGTADSECSGAAQIVGNRRKFSSSLSINDDFYAGLIEFQNLTRLSFSCH